MMMGGCTLITLLLLGLGLLSLAKLAKVGRRPKDAPPGRPTVPLLGNLRLVSFTCISATEHDSLTAKMPR